MGPMGTSLAFEQTPSRPPAPVKRPALRYPGGKWRLAPWVLEHFPPHDCYVEPFGGAASLLLQKHPAAYEVLNDLSGDVVNFFRVLRQQPQTFIRAIELTPWSRQEFEEAAKPTNDPLERARRFAVRCWQSHAGGGLTQWTTGWRYQRSRTSNKSAVLTWGEMDHLWDVAARLKRVQIEHDDALAVIRRFDTPQTLFYVDPPYVAEARSKWAGKMYPHELDDNGHRALADVLRQVEGYVVLSGYPSALYDELYGDWQCVQKESRTNFTNLRTECLWLSPRSVAVLDAEADQSFGPLFELAAAGSGM